MLIERKQSEEAAERNENASNNNNTNDNADTPPGSPVPTQAASMEPEEDPLTLIEVQVALEKLKESSAMQIQQLQEDVAAVSFHNIMTV